MSKKQVNTLVDSNLARRLRVVAAYHDTTMADIVEAALREYLPRLENQSTHCINEELERDGDDDED